MFQLILRRAIVRGTTAVWRVVLRFCRTTVLRCC